jgi:MFS family permease
MADPGDEHQIQSQPSSSAATGASNSGDAVSKQRPRNLLVVVFFGAFAGLLLGAFFGGAACWLIGQDDFLWHGALAGAGIGPFGGMVLAVVERLVRGAFVRPDYATHIGVVYGLPSSLFLLLGGFGQVRGKASGYLLAGLVCIGPILGLMLGALLDRAYEAGLNQSWRGALKFGVVGVAAVAGILLLLDLTSRGPEPEVVATEVEYLVLKEWHKQPDLQATTIQKVILERTGRKSYAGFLEAMIGKRAERFRLTVTVENSETFVWELQPLDK